MRKRKTKLDFLDIKNWASIQSQSNYMSKSMTSITHKFIDALSQVFVTKDRRASVTEIICRYHGETCMLFKSGKLKPVLIHR